MKRKMKSIVLALFGIFTFNNLYAQHSIKTNTDGIETYSHPAKLQAYLGEIDKSYLPYMFASDEDMQWWKDAKFGVFVHWAPAVVNEAALSWGRAGRKPHHKKDNEKKGIPEQEYNDTYKTFNPTKFNAEEWVKLWKEAGAKYFVFTTKHHYGFCMWDTKTTDFNIMNTPYGKDVVKQIADACHKYDMRLMWYYSQPDWTNELYRQELPSEEFNEKILYPQVRELMTNYGKIDGMWFDGLGKHPKTWNSPKLLKIIRDINPHAIVNHRIGSPDMHMGDFDGPERGIGRFQTNRPWETCEVIGGGWGYMGEKQAMPYRDVIKLFTKIVGNGGNLLLDTGPRPDGSIIESHVERYKEIGGYLNKYGNAIYNTQAGPYISGPWGASTRKGNKVWLHIMGQIEGYQLTLPKLPANIKNYKVLTGGDAKVSNSEAGLVIKLDKRSFNKVNTIVELELDKEAEGIDLIKTTGEPIFFDAKVKSSSEKSESNGASNLLPGAKASFSEGISVKKSWMPAKDDSQPWVEYTWKKSTTINQISIQEGRRLGANHAVKDFEILAYNDGKWQTVYHGSEIGSFFSYTFKTPIKAEKLKIKINKLKGSLDINKIAIYRL
jgi:alpha-L-fucosidase